MQWTSKVQNVSFAKDQNENHANNFFIYKQGMIRKECVREEQTVNSAF
jgi:hypothetical protein